MKKIFIAFLFSVCIAFSFAQVSCNQTGHGANCPTEFSVTIYNSYSGSLVWSSGNNMVISGENIWTNQTQLHAFISASTTSQFSSSGDVAFFQGSGNGVSGYTLSQQIMLSNGDGNKTRSVRFLKNQEPYDSNHLNISLDTTAPSVAEQEGPINNTLLQSTGIQLKRTPSIDTGIGLSHYIVYLSLSSDMSVALLFQVSHNQFQILSSQLPLGTLYWKVASVDFLGNTSFSPLHYFHNQAPSLPVANNHSSSSSNGSVEYKNVSQLIPQNSQTKQKNESTILQLQNGSFHWLDEDMYNGPHTIENNLIKDIMLEQFHSSPGSDQWQLPKTLPKTGSWGKEMMKQIDQCRYSPCEQKSMVWEWFLLRIFIIIFLRKIFQKYNQKIGQI